MKPKSLLVVLLVLLAQPASLLADTHRWTGAAADKPEIVEVEFGGTWADGEYVQIACGNAIVRATLGSGAVTATSDVATAFKELVNADSNTDPDITSDMTIDRGGQEFGPFKDFAATIDPNDTSSVWLTSTTPGVPFTVQVSTDTASGTITTRFAGAGDSQSATGSQHWDNTLNWDPEALPAAGDVALFDNGDVSCKYAIAQATENITFRRTNQYFGDIGLPEINKTHTNKEYYEYRDTHLTLPALSTGGSQSHIVGDPTGITPQGTTRLDLDAAAHTSDLTLTVYDSASIDAQGNYAIQVIGGDDLNVTQYGGSLQIGKQASGGSNARIDSVDLLGSGTLLLDVNSEVRASAPIVQTAGTLTINDSGTGGDVVIDGGTLRIRSTIDSVTVEDSGRVIHYSGDITTATVIDGGQFDASQAAASTVTDINLYDGFQWLDPNGRVSSTTFDFNQCQPSDGTLQLPDDQRATFIAIP